MHINKKYIKSLDETLYSGVHSSGLRVYVMPKKGFTKTYAIYGTCFGSVNNCFVPLGSDTPITVPDGVAHFLEHKMFEQEDGTNAFDLFAKYGANANAYTSFANTCYLFSCTDSFDECFAHLIDYVQKPYFTKENVEKEQGIIGQEIRMYDDDGEWKVTFNMLKALYHNNPVRIDIAGTVESIAEIDENVLYKCYNTYYNPANMAVVVAGDVDANKVFDIVEKTVLPRESGKVKSVYPDEPDSVYTSYIEDSSSVAKPLFALGFKDNSAIDSGVQLIKREAILKLIMKIIAGKNSRFYETNYDSGLINDTFDTDVMTEKSFSCVSVGGECDEPKLIKEKFLQEIESFKNKGFDKEEFERIKRTFFGSFIRSFNNVESIGGLLCRNFLNDADITDFPEIFDSITCTDLETVLKEVFNEQNCVLSVVLPNDK